MRYRIEIGAGKIRLPARLSLIVLVFIMLANALLGPARVSATQLTTGGFVNIIVDPFRPRLYVADQINDSILVLNTTSDQNIKSIPVGPGPRGLDVSADGAELYVALTGTAALAVVDLTTLTFSRTIPLQFSAYDVAAGRPGRAYVTSGLTVGAMIVDTVNNTEVGLFPSADSTDKIQASLDRNFVYTGSIGSDPTSIEKWSVQTDSPFMVGGTAFGSVGGNFADLAVSPDNITLLIASAYPYSVIVENTRTWTQTGSLQTGAYPNSVSFAQNGKLAFATNRGNRVFRFNMTNDQLLSTYNLSQNAQEVRAVPDGSKAYVITADVYGGNKQLEVIGSLPPSWPASSRITVSNLSISNVTLTWTPALDVIPIAEYDLYGGSLRLASLPGTILSYKVTHLTPGATYNITVQASDGTFQTTSGPWVVVTIPPDTTPPVWPQGNSLTVYALESTSLAVSWTPAMEDTNVAAYRIYEDGILIGSAAPFLPGHPPLYWVRGLRPGTPYTFKVEAGDPYRNWSNDGPSVSVTTPARPTPQQPSTPSTPPGTATSQLPRLVNWLATLGPPILAGYAVLVSLASVLVIRRENRRRFRR